MFLFWRFAPSLRLQLPPAHYLVSVGTGLTVGMNAESINSGSTPTQTASVDFRRHQMGMGLYFPPCLGASGPAQQEEGSWQPGFPANLPSSGRMNILFIRGDGAAEWPSVFLFFSQRHSFQRLTITWASRRQGILVACCIFFLI